jgi:hypothetical protein
MSYDEWVSEDGRYRLRIYSDTKLLRFDTANGDVAAQHEKVLIVIDDSRTGRRVIDACEGCIQRQEGTIIYVATRGRRASRTEPLPTRRDTFVPRRTRQPIGIQEDY